MKCNAEEQVYGWEWMDFYSCTLMPIGAVEFRVRIHFSSCSLEHPLSSLDDRWSYLGSGYRGMVDGIGSLRAGWLLSPTSPLDDKSVNGGHHDMIRSGSAFIKPDQRNPWIKDQIKITLLPIISHLLLPNFVSCGRACPSHMTQNLVTVGAKLWTADRFIVDPWSMDYADPVW